MTLQTKHFYAFGPFRLDADKRVLVRDGVPVPLAPKTAEALLVLVENAGRLVDKEDLMKRVWPDAFVEEGNLNKNIFLLRKVLGEWDGGREYIETVAKRGYRFVAPVNEVTHAEGDPQPQTSAGTNLLGKKVSHYRVLEIVGGGGMGLVYKAEDLKLGRRVALKFLPEEVVTDSLTLQRFEREARTASSLNHPNICTIYEFGEHERQPFIVMELLEGQTLRDLLASSAAKAVPLKQILDIAIQICDGLQAAHQKGIIHRDIKPANIFLTAQGPVKILDFGLAKLLERGDNELVTAPQAQVGDGISVSSVIPSAERSEASRDPHNPAGLGDIGVPRLAAQMQGRSLGMTDENCVPADPTLTRTGLAMGTAGYMSPEQVRGEKLDARTDLFSFGLVLYEMATGHRAFSGETAAILKDAILNHRPAPLRELNPGLPAKLEAIIGKALEKDRESRYQDASGISADLKQLRPRVPTVYRPVMVASAFVLLMVAAVWIWVARRPLSLSPELKLRQLTFNSSENSVGPGSAISQDGKYLAYFDYRGIHVRLIETGETHDIRLPEALKDSPDWQVVQWFPDGAGFLAAVTPLPDIHHSNQGTSVWRFSILGNLPLKLRDDVDAWSISPDGSLIAFGANPGRYGDRELWLMGADGKQARNLYETDENSSIVGSQWGSDGQRLLYLKVDKSGVAMESRDLGGGPPVKILSFTDNSLGDYVWLPDGRIFYVLIERSSNEYTCNYWEVRIDEHNGELIDKPRRVTNWTGACMADESVTADGKRLTFRRWTAQHSVYLADLATNGTSVSTPRQITPTKNKNYLSAWTADSSAVIFTSRGNGRWGIYKQHLDNEVAEPLVASLPGYRAYEDSLNGIALPRASPDGQWVLYTNKAEKSGSVVWTRLMRVAMSGGEPETVLTADLYGPPACSNPPARLCAIAEQSPHLKQLVFTAVDPQSGRGRELTRFDMDVKGDYVWALSPDGNHIALLNTVEGPIHILSFDGKAAQEVKVKGWNSLDSVAWAANGTSLYTSARTQRGSVLLHVDLRGNSQVLWQQEGGRGTYAIPSPDGRHLAIKSWTLDSNIWVMENF